MKTLGWTLALTTLATFGCQGARWKSDTELTRSGRVRVELERWSAPEGEPPPHECQHPAAVDFAWLEALLATLRIHEDEEKPIVDHAFVGQIAASISEGLAQADSQQRVRFMMENTDRVFGVLPTINVTRGVAFVDPDGTLNLVFDLVTDKGDYELGSWGDPTRRRITRERLVLPPGGWFGQDRDGDQIPLWLCVSMTSAEAPIAVDRTATPDPTDPTTESATGSTIDAPEGTEPPLAPSADQVRRIRIEFLEQLFREGLLGERAYREKRAELEGDG